MRLNFWIYILVPTLLLLGGIAIRIADPGPIQQLRLIAFDTLQRIQPREYNPNVPVRIVDIDDESLERIGQWPWSRDKMASIVAQLTNMGADLVAFDFVFAEPDRTAPSQIIETWGNVVPEVGALRERLDDLPDPDSIFADMIGNPATTVITGFVLNNGNVPRVPQRKASYAHGGDNPRAFVPRYGGAVANLVTLEEGAVGNGSFNMVPDIDGVVRRVPLMVGLRNPDAPEDAGVEGFDLYPSLSAEVVRVFQRRNGAPPSTYIVKSSNASGTQAFGESLGIINVRIGGVTVPTDVEGQLWVHYTDFVPERYVPAWRLFEPDFDPTPIQGHVVLIGTSAAGLLDLRATPLNPALPGVEVHAQAVEQMFTESYLIRQDSAIVIEMLFALVLGVLLVALLPRVGAGVGAIMGLVAVAAAFGTTWYFYAYEGKLLDPVYPALVALVVYISAAIILFLRTEAEKREVRQAFGMYLSPDLVEQLAEQPEKLTLGGEMRDMTILFMDVRGFTTISEQFDAVGLTRFINRFLTPMTATILEARGTIDKYMGDCIMAFWNAPLDDPDHAANACRAALKMTKVRDELNVQLRQEAEAEDRKYIPLNVGIGANTGNVCVGNMGSEQRFDYSVLGDDVNLASRLEGQSKTYGVDTVIGEQTKVLVPDFATVELDLIKVKGKTKPVRIFALLGDEEVKKSEAFQKLAVTHDAMMTAYRNQHWDQALELGALAKQLAHSVVTGGIDGKGGIDGFYELYEERIAEFKQNPPGPDWDGVYTATSK